jgi:Fe-S cluster biogenesis protein NfuA/nitrite reductase/ring-hydroxylating ferredoxin subunit
MAAEVTGPAAGGVPPEELLARFEELSAQVEQIADPVARQSAEEMIATLLDLYGEGLGRIFGTLEAAGPAAAEVRDALAGDGLVASLMLIHGLYPVDLETRVIEALDGVRPYMESHGGNVELVGVVDGVARIKLEGSCQGCAASASTLELAIKQALDEAAPDLDGLEVEGMIEQPPMPAPSGTELPVVQVEGGDPVGQAASQPPPPEASWFMLDGVNAFVEDQLVATEVAGTKLVLAEIEGSLLAYVDACADCGKPLRGGELSEGVLACPSCARRYYLPRAGRSLDGDRLQLAPVPLLREGAAGVKVALAG